MARRGDPRGPSNAHVRVHVGGALVPRSAKWGRLVRRFWPVFGTLEYAAGTMDAGWHAKRWRAHEAAVIANPAVSGDQALVVEFLCRYVPLSYFTFGHCRSSSACG